MKFITRIFVYLYLFFKNIFHFSFFINTILLFASYYATYIHPDTFILLPFLSLLFPLFLILNVFYIIFYAMTFQIMRWIVALVILIFFFPQIKEYYNISFSKPIAPTDTTLSVMSFNVKVFDLYTWNRNHLTREKIFQYLSTHPADIMCFQEFYTSEDSNDFNNLDALKKLFPEYYFHTAYFVTLRQNDHWGLLTMSRYPIIHQSVIYFNNAKNNGCIYSDILWNKDTIRVFNLHLQSYSLFKIKKWKSPPKAEDNFFDELNKDARGMNLIKKIYHNNRLKTQQSEMILKVSQEAHYPTLIVGDFNDLPNSYLMRQLKRYLFKDAFTEKGNGFGFTYHDKLHLRIDYIFHDDSFETLQFITDNKNTSSLSDHYPIIGIFKKVSHH